MKTKLVLFLTIIWFNKINAQIINTLAGNGTAGYSGDGGAATAATLYYASRTFVDASGNVYIGDEYNHVIRKVSVSGIITTVAGNGTQGYGGDGGAATAAMLAFPKGVFVDPSGNIYIADQANQVIRKVSVSGIITTVAGNGTAGYNGDGGAATAAILNNPSGVSMDASGNIYIADQANHVIRKVSVSGIITTVAGTGTAGYSGDGGPATAAMLYDPSGISVDASGNIFIADFNNNRIRKVSVSGIITTIAGNGTAGFSGDGGGATAAMLNNPAGVFVDASGNIYIADYLNNRVRKVAVSGIIATVAGNGTAGFNGDGGSATTAMLNNPTGLSADASGNIYIADYNNHRVRKVTATTGIPGEAAERGGISIYPNPASGTVVIDSRSTMRSIEVYNMFGEKVYRSSVQQLNTAMIDISEKPAGIYFLDIKTEKGSFTQKLIIQN